MKILTKANTHDALFPSTGVESTPHAVQAGKKGAVCPSLAKRVENLIANAGQITGVDVAAEMGMSIEQLRMYTTRLQADGRVHKMRGRQYLGGVWIAGPERAGEHERGQVALQLRVKHWQRLAFKVDLAEALLFNRFPAITATLLADTGRSAKSIRLAKTE